MRRKVFYISLIVFLISLFLLVTGSKVLTLSVGGAIPLGNISTWLGIISFPLIVYTGIKSFREPIGLFYRLLSSLLKVLLFMSLIWGVVSYILSGNFSFTFTGKDTFPGGETAMKIFWTYTYAVVSGVLLVLVIYWLSLLFKKIQQQFIK